MIGPRNRRPPELWTLPFPFHPTSIFRSAPGLLYLTRTKTPSINRTSWTTRIHISLQHRTTPLISTFPAYHPSGRDSWPSNSSRYPSFRLIDDNYPATALHRPSAGDQAR